MKSVRKMEKHMNSLKLKEIIFEITLACNKECGFCGSKKYLRHEETYAEADRNAHILRVAEAISEYPPEEIVFSGGEPGMVDPNTLKKAIWFLRKAGCNVKAVTNGLLIKNGLYKEFDWVGLSVNSQEEADEWDKYFTHNDGINKITIVTNFGKHNIWEYNIIKALINGLDCIWQIQLTDGELALPIDGVDVLKDKIKNTTGIKIVEADNLQDQHTCTAGWYSCGILENGDVVPCLSMRSWKDDIPVEGNVLKTPLKDIWETGFRDRRFNGNEESCRDCFFYPVKPKSDSLEDSLEELLKNAKKSKIDLTSPPLPNQPIQIPSRYPSPPEPIIMMYAVFDERNYDDINIKPTITTSDSSIPNLGSGHQPQNKLDINNPPKPSTDS